MSFNYSLITNENFSGDDFLFSNHRTSVNCNTTRILGIFLCIAALIGIALNGTLFYSFIRYKALRSPPNIFIMCIMGMGLFASCTVLPLTGTSLISCRWLYQREGCQLTALFSFFYACSGSYLFCGASLSRCYIIVRPFQVNHINMSSCLVFSSLEILFGFIWSMLPLMGWNEYTTENVHTFCSINWYDRRTSYIAFLWVFFIVVYCIPLIILTIANTITLLELKRMRKKMELSVQNIFHRKRIETERRILIRIIITTVGFFFTWTPYAVAFFVSALRRKDYFIPPMTIVYCACFAKTSVLFIPIFYFSISTQFQLRFANRDTLGAAIEIIRIGAASSARILILPQNHDEN
ncbi:unnamed protein product [Rotaria sp. Silwood2]|nr:unnamed protein product [Rotaria sp. Silwood2]CAF2729714.1 unnamed protein product [Rotaria sp. Silwood2]CAF3318869.1 unnamed protein product [Rotaria sp. Silwood2]CAF3400643.1 unnamed protein product [Rotaria sp. Silwood2]CAF4094955.1 unnamed protein product [Rotaria sp. Silwood2]